MSDPGETEFAAGDRFADFSIEVRIGSGARGSVYRAQRRALQRTEAVKVFAPRFAADPESRTRLAREATSPALSDHPHVLTVYEVGEADGRLYAAMQYVEEGDLRRRILTHGVLAPVTAAELTRQLARALDAAHAAGLIHGGLTSANVLVAGAEGAEHAYLSDFGQARRDGCSNVRADTYALACVLFEMLMGRSPELDRTAAPDDDALPVGFGRVLARALAADPGARYATAGELGAAAVAAASVGRALGGETTLRAGIAAATPPAASTVIRPPRRHSGRLRFDAEVTPAGPRTRSRVLAAAALAVVIVVGGLLILASRGRSPTRSASRRTDARPATRTPARPTAALRPAWPRYRTAAYSASYPPGWHIAEDNVAIAGGSFLETRFVNATGTAEIDIDRTPGDPHTPQQAAVSVQAPVSTEPGYRQFRFAAATLAGAPAWQWSFELPPGGLITVPGRRIDFFRRINGDRYATLGVGASARAMTGLTHRVAASIRTT